MIVFVDQTGQLGGAELCLADIAAHRRDDGRVVLFSEGPFADLLREKGVRIDILPLPAALSRITKKAGLGSLAAALPATMGHVLALRGYTRKADAIYLNTAKALLHGTAANLFPRKPCIFHLHDLLDAHHFSGANIRMLVAAANRAQAVIANSRATARAFAEAGGHAETHVIPNGFDPSPFDRVTGAEIAAIRAEWNPEGRPVAAIFGRLARWKGQDVLIRAAAKLPDLTVWIIGDALFTGEDRAFAEELKVQAARIGSRVRFLGFQNNIPALMRAADIVVHCSVAAEPFGRVLVEGMLAGKPVVATRAGGPLEILGDGDPRFLVPPGDVDALASILGELAASPDLRSEVGRLGRQRAERLYSLETTLAQTDRVISEVLGKS